MKQVKVLSARDPDVHEEAAKRLYDTYILPTIQTYGKMANEPQLRVIFLRRYMSLADEMTRLAWEEGVKAAAEFTSAFDGYIQHEWQFGDVILYKFNLRKARPRLKTIFAHNLRLIGLQTLCKKRHLVTLKGIKPKIKGAKTRLFGSDATWCRECQALVVFSAPIYAV